MHIEAMRVKNFRRLKDARIDLDKDISIFVGANNSGKTSAAHAIGLFLGEDSESLSVHDFSASTWAALNAFGNEEPGAELPTITMDLWLTVKANDLYRVITLLPSVKWQGSVVGIRIEFAAKDPAALLVRYKERRQAALAAVAVGGKPADIEPTPRNLREFLTTNIRSEFGLRYFVLDRAEFDEDYRAIGNVTVRAIEREPGRPANVLSSLIKVDMLDAQRHLSDSAGGARAEDLTKRIGRLYASGANERGRHPEALRALMDAEQAFNKHLKDIFEPVLSQIGQMGYPGVANPKLMIRSSLNPAAVLSAADGAQVHYALSELAEAADLTLPDKYNGLGYKNLIYMVIELFDVHAKWRDIEENRPLLHLIFIEEPEAHLHMQLQQVFIRKVMEIVKLDDEDAAFGATQIVVTTHSSHIVYERGFVPVRYFRRSGEGGEQVSEVMNLSRYYQKLGPPLSDFLVRYMKLTHCDLFFADAAILVEGNVERLLLPEMIAIAAPRLETSYLSVLEVGGAYAHVFRELIEFLGLKTLVITDIDSVLGPAPGPAVAAAVEDDEEDDDEPGPGSACVVATPDAVTSNRTLIEWLPGKHRIDELLAATAEERTQNGVSVHVVYQSAVELTWNAETKAVVGRTLEEAFVLENFTWCQHPDRKGLSLRFRGADKLDIDEIVQRVHKRIGSSTFKKTNFALGLLEHDPQAWKVPRYIREGLQWLEQQVVPPTPLADAVVVVEVGVEDSNEIVPAQDGAN